MIGDYIIETRLGEIRQLPQSALGYCEIDDRVVGIIEGENPTMVQIRNPFPKRLFYGGEMSSITIPLSDIKSVNEYYYGWKAINKNIKIKLAELILGRKILGTRKK